MATKGSLLLAVTLLAVLSGFSPTSAATASVEERVVLEASIIEPFPAQLRATLRVRRFLTASGSPVSGDLDQQSVTLELCDASRGCGTQADLKCFASAPAAAMRVDADDVGWVRSSGCALDVSFSPSGYPFATANGVQIGYIRTARIRSAVIGGKPALLEAVTLRKLRGAHAG